MASSEGKQYVMVDKFGGDNFNLYKFILEMVLVTVNPKSLPLVAS